MTNEIPGQAVRQNWSQESRAGAGQAGQVEQAPNPGLPAPESAEATPAPRCAGATRQGPVPQRQPQVRQLCSLQGRACLR